MRSRGVLLDRDGVLNRTFLREGTSHPPLTAAETEMLPGVAEAVAELESAGLVLVGVSNQPDVARGKQTAEAVEAINRCLLERLPALREILVCPHDDEDDCGCRKPRPGLLLRAAERHDLDLARSFVVGDRWSDVVAGSAAGCMTFLVMTPYSRADRCRPDFVVSGLREAAEEIVRQVRAEQTVQPVREGRVET